MAVSLLKSRLAALFSCAVFAAGAALLFPSCGYGLDFGAKFYYVCYKCPSDALSVSSISSLVESYGGAGYIVQVDGVNYVTVSAYYGEEEALSVQSALAEKQLSCQVVEVSRTDYSLPFRLRQNAQYYAQVLGALYSLSVMCYDLANDMDGLKVGQSAASAVLDGVQTSLDGLSKSGKGDEFCAQFSYLSAQCEDVNFGYILPGDVRRLQIAICDAIINCSTD